ncbi:hypothetical protein NLM33_35835 [Bradyrhizobium sp. CCGUVB1N3]|uniref:hypothetical protein n=1 Tax=Bradyrhizobium sp. CCGUVB1N3 TaxID=2949629 RepID=UPI0020B4420F|nr:hypothetical protein [Bradyrhizobium sp. CCGUVB1N3]MCP3475647.1 hypothetical protein [Bradyrhizobium sp. CCGUVB1N3]
MPKATRVLPRHDLPRLEMPKTATLDPVVELSRQLLDAWYTNKAQRDDEAITQMNQWHGALEELISFTTAQTPAGALVQLAPALNVVEHDIENRSQGPEEGEVDADALKIKRLVRSAMQAIRNAFPDGMDRDVIALLNIYVAGPEWSDRAQAWAAVGRERLALENRHE